MWKMCFSVNVYKGFPKCRVAWRYFVHKPGFHHTANAATTTQKQGHYKVEQSSFALIALFKPDFHQANYDHDNDQFRVKTKRLARRMTAQLYNRFVFVSWSWHLPCNGNQAKDSKLFVIGRNWLNGNHSLLSRFPLEKLERGKNNSILLFENNRFLLLLFSLLFLLI